LSPITIGGLPAPGPLAAGVAVPPVVPVEDDAAGAVGFAVFELELELEPHAASSPEAATATTTAIHRCFLI
jgi:hypothetical protein